MRIIYYCEIPLGICASCNVRLMHVSHTPGSVTLLVSFIYKCR
jgi:hypothetical protein